MRGLTPGLVKKLYLPQNVQTVPENNPAAYVMQKAPRLLGVKQKGGEEDLSPSSSADTVWFHVIYPENFILCCILTINFLNRS
jgi:hypothetical protein